MAKIMYVEKQSNKGFDSLITCCVVLIFIGFDFCWEF